MNPDCVPRLNSKIFDLRRGLNILKPRSRQVGPIFLFISILFKNNFKVFALGQKALGRSESVILFPPWQSGASRHPDPDGSGHLLFLPRMSEHPEFVQ